VSDVEMVTVAAIVTDITSVFTLHMRCISVVRFLYFRTFYASYLTTFLSPQIATSVNIHVPLSLSQIVTFGLLLRIVMSVCNC
jgi:hypothetical protein